MRTREEQIKDLSSLFIDIWDDCPYSKEAATEHILEAERRAEQRVRAEIGRDSERLDWLEQKFRSCTVYMNGEQMFMPGPKVRNLKGRDFREAIDAAREVE
ncbi:hypothetical protein [Acetobacter cerevisiae]|uniref:hypothetical protein n=1 Tax=Acetobacter cerevisiae TaxID=178900 RepID=UPI00209D6689|nr:hypothetical protein [Acetobacter cerevisiae]MCP1271250.1 hypothetical protein [Acetobacter cerevisiae]MCP1279204.1 hypothetical protein [Acetobacter cerevisiae]